MKRTNIGNGIVPVKIIGIRRSVTITSRKTATATNAVLAHERIVIEMSMNAEISTDKQRIVVNGPNGVIKMNGRSKRKGNGVSENVVYGRNDSVASVTDRKARNGNKEERAAKGLHRKRASISRMTSGMAENGERELNENVSVAEKDRDVAKKVEEVRPPKHGNIFPTTPEMPEDGDGKSNESVINANNEGSVVVVVRTVKPGLTKTHVRMGNSNIRRPVQKGENSAAVPAETTESEMVRTRSRPATRRSTTAPAPVPDVPEMPVVNGTAKIPSVQTYSLS